MQIVESMNLNGLPGHIPDCRDDVVNAANAAGRWSEANSWTIGQRGVDNGCAVTTGNWFMTPEIRAFEYAIGVFAVLVGLAIADIATSFQRLLSSESKVKWDPLTLVAAAYSLCMAIYMWFDLWGVRNFAATRHFFFYIALFAELFILYLIAASCLPAEGGAHDLRDFLSKNRRRFRYWWSCSRLATFSPASFSSPGRSANYPA